MNKKSTNSNSFISSWIGRNRYAGFFLDWLNEMSAAITYFIILTTSASFYVGMCFYIRGMVHDLEIQMNDIGELLKRAGCDGHVEVLSIWWLYVREIRFHYEIIG